MAIIFHILKYKFLSFIKLNTTYDTAAIVKNVGSFIIYSSFAVGAFYFSYSTVKYLLEVLKIGLFLLHEFFSITLFIFFIAVNVGNIIVSYSTLYKSSEVNYLFSKPISPSYIFVIKFFDNFFYSSSTLILILLSVLGGYAYYLHLSIWEIALIFFFNFIPFMLTAAALGIIVLLLIVKFSTLFGARIVLFILAVCYLLSLTFFFGMVSPVDLVTKVMKFYPNVDLYFSDMLPTEINYLPNHWLSESMYLIARDNIAAAGKYFFLQIVTSLSLLLLALVIGMKWYRNTWFYSFKLRKQNAKPDLERVFSFTKKSFFSERVQAILKREFHLFMREPTQIFHISILTILIIIFLSSVSSLIYLGGMNIFMQTVIYLSVFIFNTFLVATLSLRFVFPLFSLEGNTFWKIKSSPISTMYFLKLKVSPYLFLILFVSISLSIVVNRLFNLELLLLMTLASFLITISLVALNFSLGAFFADFKEKNPIRIASSQGASLSFLLSLIYMIVLTAILYLPINFYFSELLRYGKVEIEYLLYAVLIIAILTGIILTIAKLLLKKSLQMDF